MRKSTRRELNKLRELVAYLLRDRKCCFCHRVITDHDGATDGEGRGRPLTDRITIHHRNQVHHDKRRSNERLAHQTCHKSFHARQRTRHAGRFLKKGQSR